MKSNLEELKALRNKAQTESQSTSQQSPVSDRPFKEPEFQQSGIPGLDLTSPGGAIEALQNLDTLFQQSTQGLSAGEAHTVAEMLLQELATLDSRSDQVSNALEYIRDPDTLKKLAFIKMTNRIAAKKSQPQPQRLSALKVPAPQLPGLADFSRFYQSQDLSAPQLGASNNNENPEPQTASSTGKPESDKI